MDKKINVLFLCIGNSGPSLFSEKLLNRLGKGKFKAYSAGIYSHGSIDSFTLQVLEARHYSTHDLRSKSWLEFALKGAPKIHYVFTVCQGSAIQALPDWLGNAQLIHLNLKNPVDAEGSVEYRFSLFNQAFDQLESILGKFIAGSAYVIPDTINEPAKPYRSRHSRLKHYAAH